MSAVLDTFLELARAGASATRWTEFAASVPAGAFTLLLPLLQSAPGGSSDAAIIVGLRVIIRRNLGFCSELATYTTRLVPSQPSRLVRSAPCASVS